MGRLWLSDFILLRSLAWNLRLACRARRYGDRGDGSLGAGCSPAPAWLCGGQELRGLEPFRHFGPYRGREKSVFRWQHCRGQKFVRDQAFAVPVNLWIAKSVPSGEGMAHSIEST